MPEKVFQESAAKVAIGFFSKIAIFENAAFSHVTEVPTSLTPTSNRRQRVVQPMTTNDNEWYNE